MARISDKEIFLRRLEASGGRAANGQLRQTLGWDEDKYWRALRGLYEDGRIERGRERGGTVLLVAPDGAGTSSEDVAVEAEGIAEPEKPIVATPEPGFVAELQLYEPVLKQLQKRWARERDLDECHCEVTALQGRRDTGGSWSRPDLCIMGSRTFEYYPARAFELHTFEVKAANDVTIKGVLEALAHREAATRAYVLYHTAGKDFLSYPESARIEELAGRHGIGVIAAHTIDDFDSWEERVSAPRSLADPEAMNTFIGRSLSEEGKRKIRRWFTW
jgi:hypothetical protein